MFVVGDFKVVAVLCLTNKTFLFCYSIVLLMIMMTCVCARVRMCVYCLLALGNYTGHNITEDIIFQNTVSILKKQVI
jgi:hypothetical protein